MQLELNIGLNADGQANTPAHHDARAAQALARLTSGRILQATRYETTYDGPDGATTEPGLFVRLDTNNFFSAEENVYSLAVLLGQDCISLYSPLHHTGRLIGPRAAQWGAFDYRFFHRPEHVTLPVAA